MGDLLGTVKGNWAVITGAPWAFLAVTVLIVAIVWVVVTQLKSNQLTSLEGRLKLRDDEIADYKRKLSGASPDQAKHKIEALEREIEALKPRQRVLTDAQRTKLTEFAKAVPYHGRFEVICARTSHEAAVYAAEICEALNEGGWATRPDTFIGGAPRLKERGLTLAVENLTALQPVAAAVQRALEAGALAFKLVEEADLHTSGRLYVDLAE